MAFLSAFTFSLATPINKLLLTDITPLALSGWTYLIAGAILLPSFKVFKTGDRFHKKDIPKLSVCILSGGFAAPLCVLTGLTLVTAFQATLFLNSETVFTLILALGIFHEKVKVKGWIGIVLILAILLLWSVNFNILNLSSAYSPGVLLIMLGCFFWGLDNNIDQKLSVKPPAQLTCIKGLSGGAISLLVSVLFSQQSAPTAMEWVGIVCLAFITFSISIVLFLLALKNAGTITTSSIFSISPLMSSILTIFINGNIANAVDFAVLGVVLLGILLLIKDKQECNQPFACRFPSEEAVEKAV